VYAGGAAAAASSFWVAATVGVVDDVEIVRPGGVPANITRPAWSHSILQSADTKTSADTKGWRKAVYRIGAVEVSPVGGLRQRSVFGGAESTNEPIHSGIESAEVFRALNEARSGVTVGIGAAVFAKTFAKESKWLKRRNWRLYLPRWEESNFRGSSLLLPHRVLGPDHSGQCTATPRYKAFDGG
jgi:hypothetical protein